MAFKTLDKIKSNNTYAEPYLNGGISSVNRSLHGDVGSEDNYGDTSKGIKAIMKDTVIQGDGINGRYGKKTFNGANYEITGGFLNTKGQEALTLGVARDVDMGTNSAKAGMEHIEAYNSNPLVYGKGEKPNSYIQKIVTESSGTYINAQNGSTTGINTTRNFKVGIEGLAGQVDEVGYGITANLGYTKETMNIIPVGGYSVNLMVGGNPTSGDLASFRAGLTTGYNVDGRNGAGITSDYGSSIKWGAGVSMSGLPYASMDIHILRDGYVRRIDPLAMANVFNLVGAITAWYRAFNPEKVDIPRFEIMRPDDNPNYSPHVDMFSEGKTVLNRDGIKELTDLVVDLEATLKKNPNDMITLELGNYFDNNKSGDNKLNEIRQNIVKQEIERIAESRGIPLDKINIVLGETKVSADDKRLTIHDNNTNIKIVSNSSEIHLTDTKHGFMAKFDSVRASPAGEQQYVNLLNSPEFEKFANANKMDDLEKQIVANYLFDSMYVKNSGKTMDNLMQELKTEVYDKGAKLSDAYQTRTPKEVSESILESLKQNEQLIANLKKVHPNASDREINKELKEISEYITGKSFTDPTFNELLKGINKNFGSTPENTIALGLHHYEKTFLEQGVMKSKLEDVIENFEDFVKKMKNMSDEQLKDIPGAVRMKQQMELNTDYENKVLIAQMIDNAMRGGLIGRKPEDIIISVYPTIDNLVYAQNKTLSGNKTEFFTQTTDDATAKIMQKSFKSQFSDLKDNLLSENNIDKMLKESPELQAFGLGRKTIIANIESALKSTYPILPESDVSEKITGSDLIRAKQPKIDELATYMTNAIASGKVNPDVLDEAFPMLLERYRNALADPKQQEALVSILNTDPQLKAAFEHIAQPYFDNVYGPKIQMQEQKMQEQQKVNLAYYEAAIPIMNKINAERDEFSKNLNLDSSLLGVKGTTLPIELIQPTQTQPVQNQVQQQTQEQVQQVQMQNQAQEPVQTQQAVVQQEQVVNQQVVVETPQAANQQVTTETPQVDNSSNKNEQQFTSTSAFENNTSIENVGIKPVTSSSVNIAALNNAVNSENEHRQAELERQRLEEQRLAQAQSYERNGNTVSF